jgi:hypothetical protein
MKIYFKEIIVIFILGLRLDICRTQTVNVCDNVLGQAFESELKELDMTWEEAETKAKDRTGWRNLVATLFSDGSEEDR